MPKSVAIFARNPDKQKRPCCDPPQVCISLYHPQSRWLSDKTAKGSVAYIEGFEVPEISLRGSGGKPGLA